MKLPNTMKAMAIQPDGRGFRLGEASRPVPDVAPGEVLIAVRAAGVNGHDVHQLHQGGHPLRSGETDLPGLEVAGEVVALGAGVARWKVGDRVCALLRGGGYAEFATAPHGNCLPAPANLSWAEAAVLPETYFTVWSNILVDCALAEGETFLMNGGTSGIGVAAIQIVSLLGHRVYATARGPEKAAVCRSLGATLAIDYEKEDFAPLILAETDGRGVDVVLDVVGGDYLDKDLTAMAEGGRLVFIGAARGYVTDIDLRKLVRKRLRLQGSLLRPRPDAFKAGVAAELEARIWPHIAAGSIRPMLCQTFPLHEAAAAIRFLEERRQIGKVALVVPAA